jgi:creatinine amidohydrolase
MTWREIEAAIQQKAAVLLPVGVMEEHGPHMGLAVDICVACRLAREIKSRLAVRGVPVMIAPPYYWGMNNLTGVFPGSFSFKTETMQSAIEDILTSLKTWGIHYVFTLNWHAEYKHNMSIIEAVKQSRALGLQAYACLTEQEALHFKLDPKADYLVVQSVSPIPGSTADPPDLHAGSLETALMLEYFPDTVKEDMISTLEPSHVKMDDLKALLKGGDARKLIKDGYFGDPARYDCNLARTYLEAKASSFAKLIETILGKQV